MFIRLGVVTLAEFQNSDIMLASLTCLGILGVAKVSG